MKGIAPGRTRRVQNGFCETADELISFTLVTPRISQPLQRRASYSDLTDGTSPSWNAFSPTTSFPRCGNTRTRTHQRTLMIWPS